MFGVLRDPASAGDVFAVDGQGRVTLLATGSSTLRGYDAAGRLISSYAIPAPLAIPAFSYNNAKDIAADSEGNIVYTGSTDGQFAGEGGRADHLFDCMVGKLRFDGTPVWVHQIGTDHTIGSRRGECARGGRLQAITTDPEMNVIAIGTIDGSIPGQLDVTTAGGPFVVKYAPDGSRLWVTEFSPTSTPTALDQPTDVSTDGSGSIFVVGTASVSLTGLSAPYIAKFSTTGLLTWMRVIDAIDPGVPSISQVNTFSSVSVSGVGTNIYVGGIGTNDFSKATPRVLAAGSGLSFAFVARFSADGIWQGGASLAANRNSATCPDPTNCFAATSGGFVVAAKDGLGAYLGGNTSGFLPGAADKSYLNGFIAKYNLGADAVWLHQYLYPFAPTDPSPPGSTVRGVATDSDGNPLILGVGAATVFVARARAADGVIE